MCAYRYSFISATGKGRITVSSGYAGQYSYPFSCFTKKENPGVIEYIGTLEYEWFWRKNNTVMINIDFDDGFLLSKVECDGPTEMEYQKVIIKQKTDGTILLLSTNN